ncbi:MAG: succinyl-diaminopimelate desuccinylase [Legionellales bacterium]|nr:succinyl-diaminopimelate desuccinylase [Legionellales bacterium]
MIDFNNPVKLLKKLISFKSVTPNDDHCQKFIVENLSNLGFQIKSYSTHGVTNHWITRKACSHNTLLFLCHTDVVPADIEEWNNDPFCAREEDGRIIGRGACDMKASISAMICAIGQLCEEQTPPNIALILTSDEEGDAKFGTKYVVKREKENISRIQSALIGEPTCEQMMGDVVKVGRRGSLNLKLEIHGKSGHVAYPNNIDNPIDKILKVLMSLNDLSWGNEYPDFPKSHISTAMIHSGNETFNQTPENAIAHVNWRYNPSIHSDEIKSITKAIIENITIDYTTSWIESAMPFYSTQGVLTQQINSIIENKYGLKPSIKTNGGTSDGRFISPYVKEIVEFGPINESAHQIHENVIVKDLIDLTEIYKAILRNYLV